MNNKTILRGATFSPCGKFRYLLTRSWGEGPIKAVCFVGANPSVADANNDDPTIRREMDFAARMGANTLLKVNLSPYVATDPRAHAKWLMSFDEDSEPWLVNNENAVRHACKEARGIGSLGVFAAWGAAGLDMPSLREIAIHDMGSPIMCLGTTKAGEPRHPLYLRKDTVPVEWRPR